MPLSEFAQEVLEGLSASPRNLSSKWFYDATGDKLFQDIMAMPEYYLTDAEREIYQFCGSELLDALGKTAFELVELGAGDGSKTQYLIEAFLAAGADFTYRPVDISANAITLLGERVARQWPSLAFSPLRGDYFTALDRLGRGERAVRKLVLFPGANIGNLSPEEAVVFLERLRGFLQPDDLLLTGFDLKKDPAVILAAYNDPEGHTAAFNLNLLRRINRELDADFKLERWRHWESYNPQSGATRSFLVSQVAQSVHVGALDQHFSFEAWETIAVEISQKYSLAETEALAERSGYTHLRHFQDARGLFVDSLWRV